MVITLGAKAQGATSIVWASSKGAYGGLTLHGLVLAPKSDAIAQFYRRPLSAPQILVDEDRNPAALPLRRDLATL